MAKGNKSAGKNAMLRESASEDSKKKKHHPKAIPTSKDNNSAPAMMGGKHVKMPYGSHPVDKKSFAPMTDKKKSKKKGK